MYGVVLVWWVRSKIGSGLLYWCNSEDVLQIGAVAFCTVSSLPNPVPIIGLFTSSVGVQNLKSIEALHIPRICQRCTNFSLQN